MLIEGPPPSNQLVRFTPASPSLSPVFQETASLCLLTLMTYKRNTSRRPLSFQQINVYRSASSHEIAQIVSNEKKVDVIFIQVSRLSTEVTSSCRGSEWFDSIDYSYETLKLRNKKKRSLTSVRELFIPRAVYSAMPTQSQRATSAPVESRDSRHS